MDIDYSKYIALVISLGTLGYTIAKDRKLENRVKQVELEQEQERAAAALRRSKASAPYFTPSKKLVHMLYEDDEDGGISAYHGANVLSVDRREMPKDAPTNTPVIVLLDTYGKSAKQIKVNGDSPNLQLRQEPDMREAHGLIYLKYPYVPSNHGNAQKVIISFETEDGYDLTHTYETRHGCFEFRRIDPK